MNVVNVCYSPQVLLISLNDNCCPFELSARLKSVRDLLCASALELQSLTGLSPSDVQQLLATAAAACRAHPPVPGLISHDALCQMLQLVTLQLVFLLLCVCAFSRRAPSWRVSPTGVRPQAQCWLCGAG